MWEKALKSCRTYVLGNFGKPMDRLVGLVHPFADAWAIRFVSKQKGRKPWGSSFTMMHPALSRFTFVSLFFKRCFGGEGTRPQWCHEYRDSLRLLRFHVRI